MARGRAQHGKPLVRRRPRLPLLLLAASLVGTACFVSSKATDSVAKELIIFVDFSESIRGENMSLIEHDFTELIIPSLEPGDSILVAPINEKTLTSFHPLVDTSLPSMPHFNGWADNTLQYNKEAKAVDEEVERVRAELLTQVPEALSQGGSSLKTDIFSSLVMAEKLFDDEPTRKVLILMSDMIVDYPPYRFDKISWSPEKNKELLRELVEKGMIPDLSGVCVYVSGASAGTAELAGQISAFWHSYFALTDANLDSSRYAHVLLHWPPPEACS